MERFGLIGRKLGHSFSKKFFSEKFSDEGIDASYDLFELDKIESLRKLTENLPDLKGLNVTIPYKESVIPYLDSVDEDAERIGAVNTIRVTRNQDGYIILKGYNTDVIGFYKSLTPLLNDEVRNSLVLGSGGAARAVCHALSCAGIGCTVVSRSPENVSIPDVKATSYESLDRKIVEDSRLIVNCTPLGMFPHTDECPDLPYEYIGKKHICYDLIYNPELTKFLNLCRERGAMIKNGLEMLHIQAEESWKIWNGSD